MVQKAINRKQVIIELVGGIFGINDSRKIAKGDMRGLESLKEGLKIASHVDSENSEFRNRIKKRRGLMMVRDSPRTQKRVS
ncbi:MAG: hypothetical protein DRP88_04630 [Candidatus Neomarinimicrobiota bacterium]|nr:MAG: hypothetical protein DRP88_04630 [Candidatus Neomarinimicrobiota bacterium]